MNRITHIVLVVVVALLCLDDLAVLATAGPDATISRRDLYRTQLYPYISMVVDVLIGHLSCAKVIRVGR